MENAGDPAEEDVSMNRDGETALLALDSTPWADYENTTSSSSLFLQRRIYRTLCMGEVGFPFFRESSHTCASVRQHGT